jgi:uncharacterized protein
VIAVADSSPLILLAKIGQLDILEQLFGEIFIPTQVLAEVTHGGGGLGGAREVVGAAWVKVLELAAPIERNEAVGSGLGGSGLGGLGLGESQAIALALQMKADLILLDDMRARKAAMRVGLTPIGSVGMLKAAYLKGWIPDLRQAYLELLAAGAWLDSRLVNQELRELGLKALS